MIRHHPACNFLLVLALLLNACSRAGFNDASNDASLASLDAASSNDADLLDKPVTLDAHNQDAAVDDALSAMDSSAEDGGSQDADLSDIAAPPLALLTQVHCEANTLIPGQRGVLVSLRVDNLSFESLEIVSVNLVFRRDNDEVGDFFAVSFDANNPNPIEPAASAFLAAHLDVMPSATAGEVTVDAQAQLLSPQGQTQILPGARETDSVVIIVPTELRVSTTNDEDDCRDEVSLAAAGGPSDLSLREAIRIANSESTPQTILFDPVIFSQQTPGQIVVDPALEALPPLTNAGLSLDATGAGVIIQGPGEETLMTGLRVQADAVSLFNLSVTGFGGDDAHFCLEVESVNGLHLEHMTFYECGKDESYGSQVKILGGQDHLIDDCMFRDGLRDGLFLDQDPRRVTIQNSSFINNGDDGLTANGSDVLVQGCYFYKNVGEGIEVGEFNHLTVFDSQFLDNGDYSGYAGIRLTKAGYDAEVRSNYFSSNRYYGVMLENDLLQGVLLSENTFSDAQSRPIHLSGNANQMVAAPQITVFDGQQLQGSCNVDVNRVELYDAHQGFRPLLSLTATGGMFSTQLSQTYSHVAALASTVDNSSSEFSAVVTPPSDPLIVSVVSDELDGGEGIVTVAQAGGTADLSLREALTIAANRNLPDVITFDPSVFLPGVETVIAVGSAADPPTGLPSPGTGDSLIAGTSVPVLDGGLRIFAPAMSMLPIFADGVQIKGLRFRQFLSSGGSCVNLAGDDLLFENNTVSHCGTPASGTGVIATNNCDRNVVTGNTVSDCHVGMDFYDLDDSVVSDNLIFNMSDHGIYLDYIDHSLFIDNQIHNCEGAGLRMGYSDNNNVFIGLHIYACDQAGIQTSQVQHGNSFLFSTLVGNGQGLWLGIDSCDMTVQNNIFAYNTGFALQVDDATGLIEDHNLFFDNAGDGITGSSARSDAVPLAASDLLLNPGLDNWASGQVLPNSSVVDQGVDLGYDRNGSATGLYNGLAPDIGAIEQ